MVKKLKEFEVIEYKAYIVHANTPEEAIDKFGNYEYIEESDYGQTVRELGKVPAEEATTYF
jgi:hypothetical protein